MKTIVRASRPDARDWAIAIVRCSADPARSARSLDRQHDGRPDGAAAPEAIVSPGNRRYPNAGARRRWGLLLEHA